MEKKTKTSVELYMTNLSTTEDWVEKFEEGVNRCETIESYPGNPEVTIRFIDGTVRSFVGIPYHIMTEPVRADIKGRPTAINAIRAAYSAIGATNKPDIRRVQKGIYKISLRTQDVELFGKVILRIRPDFTLTRAELNKRVTEVCVVNID